MLSKWPRLLNSTLIKWHMLNSPLPMQATTCLFQATTSLIQATTSLIQATPHLLQATPHLLQATPHLNKEPTHIHPRSHQGSGRLTPHRIQCHTSLLPTPPLLPLPRQQLCPLPRQ